MQSGILVVLAALSLATVGVVGASGVMAPTAGSGSMQGGMGGGMMGGGSSMHGGMMGDGTCACQTECQNHAYHHDYNSTWGG